MNSETATKLANGATQVLISLVPALGPYGVVIGLAMTAAETLAPAVYEEIKQLISDITDGNEPTESQVAGLLAKIADLKKPDGFFQTPPPAPATAPTLPAAPQVASADPVKCPTCNVELIPDHPSNCTCVNA